MTTDQLKRISYLVRIRVDAADISPGATVDAFAEQIADELILLLRANVLGRRIIVDAPANRWNALLYFCGLPYRKLIVEVPANGTD